MSERFSSAAAGDARAADLDWLADRFVLGELSAAETQAVEDRLAEDDSLAAAVARSSRLLVALHATPACVPPATPAVSRNWIAVAALAVAAAVALVACWPILVPRSGPAVVAGGPRDVVRLWRQADETVWAEEEAPAEDEAGDGDAVPDWMLAAVGLDATSALEQRVQEN